MPVITRTERTVQTRAVDQPFSRGDGYEAPGRAMMQLGDAIAQAGRGLGRLAGDLSGDVEAENRKRDDFAFKMATTEFANDQELKLAQEGAQIQDNGSTFMDATTERFDKDVEGYYARVPERYKEDAKLAAAKMRGDIRMGAYKAGERRSVSYYADETDRVVTSYITGDRFDGSEDSVNKALAASDAVISSAPVPEETKRELRIAAAKRIYNAWRAKADPSEAASIADNAFSEAPSPAAPSADDPAPPLDGPALKPAPGLDAGPGKGEINWEALSGALLPTGKPSPAGEPGDVIPMETLRDIAKRSGDTEAMKMSDAELAAAMKQPNIAKSFAYYYLDDLHKRYGNDVKAILIGYRSGPKVADAWVKAGRDDAMLPAETLQMFSAMGIARGSEPRARPKLTTIEEMKAKAAAGDVTDAEIIPAPDVGDGAMEKAPPATGDEAMVIRPSKAVGGRAVVPPKGVGGDTWGKLLGALIHQESGGRAGALSPVGAAGIMQVMPGTAREIARELGETDVAGMSDRQIQRWLMNPQNGMRYGIHYLKKMLARYNGDVAAALVAYNGGPGRADRWLRSGRNDGVIPAETRQYYKAILGRMGRGGGMPPIVMSAAMGGKAAVTLPGASAPPGVAPPATGMTGAPDLSTPGEMSTAGHFWSMMAGDYDSIKKADLAAERVRIAEAEKIAKGQRDQALKDGYDLIEKGELTQDWLDQHEAQFTPAQYRTFVKALAGGPAQTDPETYVGLMLRADDEPGTVLREATEALAEKRISKSDWNNVYRAADRAMRPADASPYAKEALARLKSTIPWDRRYGPDYNVWMGILKDYYDAVEANPQMDAKEAAALSEHLLGKYKLASTKLTRDSLPYSKYFPDVKRDYIGPDDVGEAVQKLARDRATMSEGDFAREVSKLKKWRDYFLEEQRKAEAGKP